MSRRASEIARSGARPGVLVLAFALAGCGSAESGAAGGAATASSPAAARRAAACPPSRRVLDGVYHPSRLRVLNPCMHASGTVAFVRHEQDGDLHIDVALAPRYRGLLAAANYSAQHGELVVEFMARDGGHLPAPSAGERIELSGAWVDDTQHSWNELHPVWAESLNGGPTRTSGPQFGGSAAGDRSYNAAADCHTPAGAACAGYR